MEGLEKVMNQKTQQLKDKLNKLKKLDKNFEVFGSELHKYNLNSCLSLAEVSNFESKCSVVLPDDYRQFLLEFGNGGAGPGYGLLEINVEKFMLDASQRECLSQPFALTKEWNNLDLPQVNNGSSVNTYFDPKYINGTIAIADYGCGIQARLVLTGEERGNIWIDDRTNEAGIYPLTIHYAAFFHDDPSIEADLYESVEEVKEALTFYEWYSDWLNRGISQVIEFG
jgi:SMI1 / KNR4 family (SUKH-1)